MGVKVRKPSGYKSWCVVIDHENQRKTIAVGTREAAERVKREVETRLSVGDYKLIEESAPATTTLKEYAAAWLKEVEFARKPSTAGFYEQYLRLYVLPAFGHLPLDRIERTDIKKFLVELRERKLSKNTIRLAITTLRAVLSSAIEDGKIKANPAQCLASIISPGQRQLFLPTGDNYPCGAPASVRAPSLRLPLH